MTLLRENLATMIELVREAGAVPLLTGIQIPPNLGLAYTEQFAAVYRELAQAHDVALVDFLMDGVALDSSRMQSDRAYSNCFRAFGKARPTTPGCWRNFALIFGALAISTTSNSSRNDVWKRCLRGSI